MDGHLCPRLAGFLRLTQKFKAKIQKKKDVDRKDLCPICGSKSSKGNLCQACFMRSFRPIAYARNIKVVEQNEFFYGPGKNGRWERGMRAKGALGAGKVNKDVLVLSSTATMDSSSEIFAHPKGYGDPECDKTPNKDSSFADPTKLVKAVEQVPSRELFKVELVDVNVSTETRGSPEPCSAFVPGFWESPPEEIKPDVAFKLKTFTDRVIKEAQRPFKEIFSDSDAYVGLSVDNRLPCEKSSIDPSAKVVNEVKNVKVEESPMDCLRDMLTQSANCDPSVNVHDQVAQNVQVNQSPMCYQSDTPTDCGIFRSEDDDHLNLGKQLKQKAILELLKVAFKTNMILNSLYQYFKKIVEADGSTSENSGSNPGERVQATGNKISVDSFFFLENSGSNPGERIQTTDSKISVDSFFFPNRQNRVRWGQTESNTDFDCNSDTEVISKSQATLSLLMAPFEKETSKGYDCQEYDNDGYTLPGPSTKFLMTPLDEPNDWLETQKFHSEYSKLQPEHPGDKFHDFSQRGASWDRSLKPATLIVDDVETGDQESHALGVSCIVQDPKSASTSHLSGKSLLDLVFGLNRICVKPSLVPLPECQLDLITLSSPVPSKDDIIESKTRKDADSQTALLPQHLEQELSHLHEAFLDQLAHFSVQLFESCKTFGHSWQTNFLAELVDHFRSACSIISSAIGESCFAVPSSDRLDELQDVSNQISNCLAKLRAHPHSFMGDCSDHDISTLLSAPTDRNVMVDTWV